MVFPWTSGSSTIGLDVLPVMEQKCPLEETKQYNQNKTKPETKNIQERAGTAEDAPWSQAEAEYVLDTYHEMMGPLGDMSEVAIQFGYVTLFTVSFPIAPVRDVAAGGSVRPAGVRKRYLFRSRSRRWLLHGRDTFVRLRFCLSRCGRIAPWVAWVFAGRGEGGGVDFVLSHS